VGQPPAHAGIAHQDELGGGVADGVGGGLTEEDIHIQVPDADDAIFFAEGGEAGSMNGPKVVIMRILGAIKGQKAWKKRLWAG